MSGVPEFPAPLVARAVRWPRPGVATVDDGVVVAEPGAGEVLVEVAVSVMSPGTERARFLGLPNALVSFPHDPGYLAAGSVRRPAPGFPAGTAVALRGVAHRSLAVVPVSAVHTVPRGVALQDAALWQFALTAMHGLAMGGYEPGEPVAVVGAGLLGIMARRIAAARGTTDCLAVGESAARSWAARAEEHTRFTTGTSVPAMAYPLVLDVTGTPEGLAVAVAATAEGGRVVVLGSPRAVRAPMPVGAIYDRGLSVVGAHVATLADGAAEEFTREFFHHLREERLSCTDVLSPYAAGDAPLAYRRLASDRSFVAAALTWRPEDRPDLRPVPPAGRRAPAGPVRPVRFGLVGCGDIGMVNGTAVAAAEHAELAACFDPVPRLAEEVARRCGGHAVTSLAELLDRDDIEAVIVATPHDTHETLTVAALDAGRHVLLEKPLAADLPSALRIAAAAKSASSRVGLLFPLRLDDRVLRAGAAIRAGLLGAPVGAVSTYLIDKPPSYYFGGFSHRATSTWRLSKSRSGGGFMMMNLIHHLDVIRALLGHEADQVYAQTLPSEVAPDIEDLVSVVVRFGETVATFIGAASVTGGPGAAIRLWGRAGQVQILPESSISSLLAVPEGLRAGTRVPRLASATDLKALAVSRFVAALRRGEAPDVGVEDGVAVQAMIAAAYASAASNRPVSPSSFFEVPEGAQDPAAREAI
ncbi:Gfo/Idh/MocA family oxidoreductase [Streptosporangium sp. NPDC049644]|uniref:Gfo/Idh/MocA family oxidoreductase n=1 Tax=Streptosporangium sp. NPDC049644 TaxID=3155507 RepID=UPI003422CCE9